MKLRELKNRENFFRQREKNLLYETNKYVYNFQQYKTIRTFASNILRKITLNDADKNQIELLNKEDH